MTMTNDNVPPPENKAPDGLLAAQAAANNTALPKDAPAAVPTPSYPGVDPNYVEPVPYVTLALEFGEACKLCGVNEPKVEDVLRLAKAGAALVQRLGAVQAALLPFAVHATAMANMKMILMANGRPREPSGGMWLNGVQGGQITATEVPFFNAMDAIGRGFIEEHVMAIFKQVQASQAGEDERDKHVENFGKVH
jgi:hypothetical protein